MGNRARLVLFLLLFLIIIGCEKQPEAPPDLPPAPPGILTTGMAIADDSIISVAAINISYQDYSLNSLVNKINSLLSNHPDVDLIVTPEYLFYGAGFAGLDYRDDPVIVDCQNNLCSVESIGTIKSNELKNAINNIQNIASQNNVNIVLGTVAEMEEISGTNFTFDTQLIIDKEGNIIGKHRMYPLIYAIGKDTDYCKDPVNVAVCEQARDSILDTDVSFVLTNRQGIIFKIVPIICGEKNEDKVIDRLSKSNADLSVISEYDVDCNYKEITQRIQAGENIFEDAQPFTCEAILKTVFDKWVTNNVLRDSGNVVVSDGRIPSAGLFNLNLEQIQELDITKDYTYGKINIQIEVAEGENCCITDFACLSTSFETCEANQGKFIEAACADLGCPIMPDWATFAGPDFSFNLKVEGSNLKVEIGADFVYRHFFIYHSTGEKQRYQFEQQPVPDSLYIEDFTTSTVSDLEPGTYFVVAYACNKLNGDYDCNNKKWMIKKIEIGHDCYLELATKNGDSVQAGEKIAIAATKEDCQSYFLAFQYADINDSLRLVIKDNPEYTDQLMEEINNRPANRYYRVQFIDYINGVPEINFFNVESNTENCEWVYFFGVPLYCFNGIETAKLSKVKDDNLGSIIAPLTFLKMSGTSDMRNTLTEEDIEPFDFLVKEKIEYVDGTNLLVLNREVYGPEEKIPEDIGSLKIRGISCEEEEMFGAANFQFRSEDLAEKIYLFEAMEIDAGEPYSVIDHDKVAGKKVKFVVFFCRQNGKARKIHYAGVLYHEANHKLYGGHVYGIDDPSCRKLWPCANIMPEHVHEYDCPENIGYLPDDYRGRFGDGNWQSVYGAHITYLFQASQNDFLTCSERNELYDEAEREFETKLCKSEHSYSQPVCELEETYCGNQICDEGETFENCPEDCIKEELNYPGNLAPFPTKSLQPYQILKQYGIVDKGNVNLEEFYLLSGPQTQLTPLIKEKANLIEIGNTDRETVNNILLWEKQYFKQFNNTRCEEFGIIDFTDEILRSRTAHEILESTCFTGCTDFALVFAALARAKGIPATITEAIDEKWVAEMVWANKFDNQKKGHFYSEVYLSDEQKWDIVDPTAGQWTVKDFQGYILFRLRGEELGTGTRLLLFERGLDSWDYGVETMQEFGEIVQKRYYVEPGDQP